MGMKDAYRFADRLMRQRMSESAPGALDDVSDLKRNDVIVTTGCYDWIQNVFTDSDVPHTVVDAKRLQRTRLNPDQVVFVNCPGEFSRKAVHKLRQFVHDGGFLFTTDWALKNVIEPAFPGYLEYNGNQTADDVVKIEIARTDDPFLASIIGPDDEPQWWLEGASYPITVLRPNEVEVLIESAELGRKYGASPVLVAFDFGAGRVYHMISHFYLQRTETRTARQKGTAYAYLEEKGVGEETWGDYEDVGAARLSLGEVESALMSRSTLSSVLWEKRRRMKKEGKS